MNPAARQPALLALVAGEGAGVDLLHVEAAGGAERPWPGSTAHSTSTSEQARPTRSGRSRSTTCTKSIRPPARSCTLPQARISPSSSRTTTFSRVSRPWLGDLDQHVVDAGAGPAAAVPLVGAQQVGQPGEVGEVGRVGGVDAPVVVERRGRLDVELLGVALEPGVLGHLHPPLLLRLVG